MISTSFCSQSVMNRRSPHLELEVPHALQIKDLVEHILGFCTLGDLKQCRLVSRFWRESSVKALKSFPVKLNSATNTKQFLKLLQDPKPVAGSRSDLYSNFHLSKSSLKLSRHSTFFWTTIGSHIKSLELSDIKLENVNAFRKIVLNICSNVQQLTLRNVSLANGGNVNIVEPMEWEEPMFGENRSVRKLTLHQRRGSLGMSWMELVNYFPSLKSLSLEEASQYHFELFLSIRITREHHPSRLELNEIHFNGQQTWARENQYPAGLIHEVLKLIHMTYLQMKKITFDLVGGEDFKRANEFMLWYIFGEQINTLETLTIGRNYGENVDPLNICFELSGPSIFENLQELEINSPVLTSMWFVKFMPNLKKLAFCQPNFKSGHRYRGDLSGVQLNKLVELKVNCEISLEGLELLFNLFPNVEHLKMIGLNNDMFTLVCERWSNLVELETVDSRVDECGITGMDEDDVKKINDQRGRSKWRPITVPRANITHLKHLRKLTMQADPADDPFNNFLGYCGKLHGFEETSSLEDVHIFNYTFGKRAYKKICVKNRKIKFVVLPPPTEKQGCWRLWSKQ